MPKGQSYEEMYEMNGEACMILEIQTPQGWMCLDATRKFGTIERLFNQAPSGRATLKPLMVNGK